MDEFFEEDDDGGMSEAEEYLYYLNEADIELQELAAPFLHSEQEYVRLYDKLH